MSENSVFDGVLRTCIWRVHVILHCEDSGFLAERCDLRPGTSFSLNKESGLFIKKERGTRLTSSAMALTSTSGPTVIDLILIFKISSLASRSGGPTYRMRSSLPGRISAESYNQIDYQNL